MSTCHPRRRERERIRKMAMKKYMPSSSSSDSSSSSSSDSDTDSSSSSDSGRCALSGVWTANMRIRVLPSCYLMDPPPPIVPAAIRTQAQAATLLDPRPRPRPRPLPLPPPPPPLPLPRHLLPPERGASGAEKRKCQGLPRHYKTQTQANIVSQEKYSSLCASAFLGTK